MFKKNLHKLTNGMMPLDKGPGFKLDVLTATLIGSFPKKLNEKKKKKF